MKHSSPVRENRLLFIARFFVLLFASMFLIANFVSAQIDNISLPSGGLKYKSYKPAGKSDDCSDCLFISIQGSLDFAKLRAGYAGAVPGYSVSPYKSKVGFDAGVFASKGVMQLGPGYLGGLVGLEFIQKGGKESNDGTSEKISLNYIELPIDVIYQYPVMDNSIVFAGLGPYFAYGIGGKDDYDDGTNSSTQPSFGNPNSTAGFKRFDFGLQFTGGFRYAGMVYIGLFYDLGLLNVLSNENGNATLYNTVFKYKNGVFGINLAYCFGLSK